MSDINAGDGVTLISDAPDRPIDLYADPTSAEVIGRLSAGTKVLVLAIASLGDAPYRIGGFDADDEYHQGWVPGTNLYKRQLTGYEAILKQNFTIEELRALAQALRARRLAASTGRPGVLTAAQSAALEKFTRLSGEKPAGGLSLMNLSA